MRRTATQLIVFGKMVNQDLGKVLAAVKEAGYDGVEMGLPAGQTPAAALKRALERNGLGLAGCHGDLSRLADAGPALDYAQEAGSRYLICSGAGSKEKGPDAYAAAAETLDRAGALARERGMVLCYHHHAWEFEDAGGKTGLQVLLERTDPERVKLCVDTFWVADAGRDPAVFLHRNLKRLALVHLKDGKPGEVMPDGGREFLELGSGRLDFAAILKVLDLSDLEWLTVEQDRSTLPPGESVRRSREYLRELGY